MIDILLRVDDRYIIKGSEEGFITEEELTNKLQTNLDNYYTKTEADNKYTSKNADSLNVVHDNRLLKIIGDSESNKFNVDIVTSSTSSPTTMNIMQIGLGKVDFGYNQIRTQHLVLAGQSLQQIIRSDMSQKPKSTDVSLYTALMIDNNFYNKTEVDTKISEVKNELQQSMTITHLAPIDEKYSINSFIIGAPVYMTGNVYVKDWVNNIWNESTTSDSIDCIPSVKTNGTWKEYLGICTHILPETNENGVLSHNRGEIKFATHGDYLVKVDDSSTYGIGDTVYIEHMIRDNTVSIPVLKILSEDIPLTTKINRMTVGIVTSIIDSKTISVFRE